MRVVAFFNHKGGVGKTTLVYNTGLALASQGKKVIFIDLDAQANLTTAAIRPDEVEKILESETTIYSSLRPVIDGSGSFSDPAPMQIRDTAWIVPGDIRLSEFEEICPQGWTDALAGNSRGFQVSTTIYRLIASASATVGADYVFLDLGPNVGALNRISILSANGFVVPLAPDLFSLTALPSVGKSTSLWVEEWRAAIGSLQRRGTTLNFDLPLGNPSPLGYISQQFAVYRQAPAAAYKRWTERIPEAYEDGIRKPLAGVQVRIPDSPSKIGEVRNLSSLIPMAQRMHSAVFELTGSEARGAQYTRARDTYSLFTDIAGKIVDRLDSVSNNVDDSA
jgi:chromosome partitioning protein